MSADRGANYLRARQGQACQSHIPLLLDVKALAFACMYNISENGVGGLARGCGHIEDALVCVMRGRNFVFCGLRTPRPTVPRSPALTFVLRGLFSPRCEPKIPAKPRRKDARLPRRAPDPWRERERENDAGGMLAIMLLTMQPTSPPTHGLPIASEPCCHGLPSQRAARELTTALVSTRVSLCQASALATCRRR
jgi:hypothetical protein